MPSDLSRAPASDLGTDDGSVAALDFEQLKRLVRARRQLIRFAFVWIGTALMIAVPVAIVAAQRLDEAAFTFVAVVAGLCAAGLSGVFLRSTFGWIAGVTTSVLLLPLVPVGTILGGYGIWLYLRTRPLYLDPSFDYRQIRDAYVTQLAARKHGQVEAAA